MGPRADRKSTTDVALAFLRELLRHRAPAEQMRLPTLQVMAKRARVPVRAMHRAVARLKREGVLDAAPRRGIWAIGGGSPVVEAEPDASRPVSPSRSYKWLHVKNELAADILRGAFGRQGALPSGKELCARYDACSHTMTKALHSLIDEGKLRPLKRGFAFGRATHHSYGTIVVIAQHHHIGLLATYAPLFASFFATLEQEQRRLGFRAHTVMSAHLYARTEDEMRNRTTFAQLEREHATLGYIVHSLAHLDERTRRLLDDAQATGKPVALLDSNGFCERHEMPRYHNVRAFTLLAQDVGPGVEMGTFLLSKGHRHIACFTYEPEPLWSSQRFAGLRTAFDPDSCPTTLHTFRAHPAEVRRPDMMRRFPESDDMYRLEGHHFWSRYLGPTAAFVRSRLPARAAFDVASGRPEITAWVTGNDALATLAWYYLRRENPHAAPAIALCSFDNSFDAFAHGITSYDFNASAAVHAMLEYLLSADTRGGEPVVEIPGVLVKRQSTEDVAPRPVV